MSGGNLEFLDVFTTLFKRLASEEIDTMLPAVIEAYDSSKRKATVKPVVNRKYKDNESSEYPSIPNVPVIMPSGGGALLKFPIKQGDFVLLVTSKVEIANFLKQGKQVDALDSIKFNISSSVAIVGLFPFNSSPTPTHADDSVEMIYGGSRVTIKANGDIELGKESFLRMVNENFKDVYNNHVHSYTLEGVPTQTSTPIVSIVPPVDSKITDNELTTKAKAE